MDGKKRKKKDNLFLFVNYKKGLNKWTAIHSKLICTWEACHRGWTTKDAVFALLDWRAMTLQCIKPKRNDGGGGISKKKLIWKGAEGYLHLITNNRTTDWISNDFLSHLLVYHSLCWLTFRCNLFPMPSLWMIPIHFYHLNYFFLFYYITICVASEKKKAKKKKKKQSVKDLKLCLSLPLITLWLSKKSDASFYWIKHTKPTII